MSNQAVQEFFGKEAGEALHLEMGLQVEGKETTRGIKSASCRGF